MSDNGGECNNEKMKYLADNFRMKLVCTAAESPWSNGTLERLNATLATSVRKIVEDVGCLPERALYWAVSARNVLLNYNWFSPNQLLYGFNPPTPNVFDGSLSQLEGKTTSQIVVDNLNAMHQDRSERLKNEFNEKLRRALLHQVRSDDVEDLMNDDSVFYNRKDDPKWHGPGTVIGRDGKQVFVKHGGIYIYIYILERIYVGLSTKN